MMRSDLLIPALFILPFALDFKSGESGGSWWQYLLVGVTVLAWLSFITTRRIPAARGRIWKTCTFGTVFSVAGSLVPHALNGNPFDQYVRVIMPVAFFMMAFLVGAALTDRGRFGDLQRLVFMGCAASAVFSVGAGVGVSGVNIGEIRYQILTPVMLPFEGLLLHRIIVAKTRVRSSVLILVACLGLQIISVTRSQLLAFAIVVAAAMWISSSSVRKFSKTGIVWLSLISVFGAVALVASTVVSPAIMDRWQERLFTTQQQGGDPTTVSRLAEIKEQLDGWSSTPATILFGKGYGAPYGWSKDLYDALLDTGAFNLEGVSLQYFEFGHNFWVSSLFAGGLVFGLVIPALLLYVTFVGLRVSRALMRSKRDEQARMIIGQATLMMVGALAFTIGGNPFAYRYTPLLLGLMLGAFVVAQRRVLEREATVWPGGWTSKSVPYQLSARVERR